MSDKSPDAFRTISEVADWLGVQPHVLRFWESKFSQVRPVKRAGGRRYYRPNDMLLLGGIRKLLHEDGLTIKGAQKVLREEGMSHVARLSRPLDAESAALSDMAGEFEEDATRATLDAPEPAEPGADSDRADPSPAPSQQIKPVMPVIEPEAPAPPDTGPADEPTPARPSASRDDLSQETPAPDTTPLPSFKRSSATRRPADAEPQRPSHDARPAAPASDRLPSFLQPPKPTDEQTASPHPPAAPAEEEQEADLPLTVADTSVDGMKDEPDAVPRPQVVDAPDPDDSAFEVASGALSASFSAASLSPHRRPEILPLVAQLAALRDRMAAGRDR